MKIRLELEVPNGIDVTKPITTWGLVEAFYPDYTSSGTIARANDLEKIISKEVDEGSCAAQMLEDEYAGDHDSAIVDYDEVHKEIYDVTLVTIAESITKIEVIEQ